MSSLALDSVTVKGFRSIGAIESLALQPVNLLIGANGSGKSNFIRVFSFLHAIREGRLQDYVREAGGADQLLHFGAKHTRHIAVDISFKGGINQYRLLLKPTADDTLFPSDEEVGFWDKAAGYAKPYVHRLLPRDQGREAGISGADAKGIADWVRLRLSLWRVYHVHDTSASSPMRRTAQLHDNAFLRPDGSNLPAFLYLLRRKHPEAYALIRASVQRVAPFFDDFVLAPDPLNEDTIRLAWKHRTSDQYFTAAALSDGTLRFIVLATLFLQPVELRPSMILVDEPELGLHPYAMTLLASLVKQAATQTQVILSTQSSHLLDHFTPEEVLVAERENGGTRLRRLTSTQLGAWLEDYSLGQLWEKNELGGRPSPD